MTGTVEFRGERVDVEYRDYGWEPDTNAHTIDWHFVDQELQKVELTQEEEDAVYLQLATMREYDE